MTNKQAQFVTELMKNVIRMDRDARQLRSKVTSMVGNSKAWNEMIRQDGERIMLRKTIKMFFETFGSKKDNEQVDDLWEDLHKSANYYIQTRGNLDQY